MAGLDEQGLTIKTLVEIQAEVDEALKSIFGNQINTLPQSVFGQLKDIFAEREALIWELTESVYNSQYPDTAQGTSLDNIGVLTALSRFPADFSRVIGQALFGTPGTIVPIGTFFSVASDPTTRLSTEAEITLGAGTNEVQDIDFSAVPTSGLFTINFDGQITASINWDDDATAVQTALNNLSNLSGVTVTGDFTAGFTITFDGSDGLQPQNILVENTNTLDSGGAIAITIVETISGVFQAQVNCIADETGAKVVNAETLTVIDNPIAGLDSVFNPSDAILGRDEETDAEYRLRRQNRVVTSKAGTTEAIRNAILKLNEDTDLIPIQTALVFDNKTLAVDFRGLPAKSFEAFVYQEGGTDTRDDEIAQAILVSQPAGIESHGDLPFVLQDSQGFDQTVKFSRPTEVDIYVILDLSTNASYPADGDTQVKNTLVTWGSSLGVGQDVIVFPTLVAQLDAIPGITDVVVKIGTAPAPTLDDNIVIDDGSVADVEISVWEQANITVNIV
jgi:uncharacterized phage protein gp47/JayE